LGGWTVLQLSKIRNNRSVSSSFSLRISATCDDRPHGPSCIYVGPLQTATQETLEALYSQVINFYFTLSLTISLHKHYLRWLIHLINLLFIICWYCFWFLWLFMMLFALLGSFWFMAVWNDLFELKFFSAYLLSSPG
jgi:hypothetical protein